MTLHDVIVIIAAGLNLIALGGFAYWARGWFTALKGAVDAQKETIAAQKEFIQGLQTVLDTTDTPKMLERLKAYKEFVDQEKEAAVTQAKRELAEVSESAESAVHLVAYLNEQGDHPCRFSWSPHAICTSQRSANTPRFLRLSSPIERPDDSTCPEVARGKPVLRAGERSRSGQR
jgi:hypothetical protein